MSTIIIIIIITPYTHLDGRAVKVAARERGHGRDSRGAAAAARGGGGGGGVVGVASLPPMQDGGRRAISMV